MVTHPSVLPRTYKEMGYPLQSIKPFTHYIVVLISAKAAWHKEATLFHISCRAVRVSVWRFFLVMTNALVGKHIIKHVGNAYIE